MLCPAPDTLPFERDRARYYGMKEKQNTIVTGVTLCQAFKAGLLQWHGLNQNEGKMQMKNGFARVAGSELDFVHFQMQCLLQYYGHPFCFVLFCLFILKTGKKLEK